MTKISPTTYMCGNCGFETKKWLGQCPQCQEWSTFEESNIDITDTLRKSSKVEVLEASKLKSKVLVRTTTKISEFDRVLGGGLVESQVVLVSGEPGIGKSTILLQVLQKLSNQGIPSLYVSAEESAQQVAFRAKRIFTNKEIEGINILSTGDIDSIINEIRKRKIKFAIIDSIQTVFTGDARGLPGGVAQIKAVSSKIISFAKENELMLIIVGQVTKEGAVAGPKLLEHLVDSVLEFEGDEKRGLRVLRCLKNRYGNVNEVGLFMMEEKGLVEVSDPTKLFISTDESKKVIGTCKTAMIEGNRVLTFEIQALVVDSPYSLPKRVAEGIARSRLELLSAILSKHGGLNLSNKDIYINVSQGFKIKDPSSDLAVIVAIYSSFKKLPMSQKIVASGEVSLSGLLQLPSRYSTIEKEIQRLGYQPISKNTGNVVYLRQLLSILN